MVIWLPTTPPPPNLSSHSKKNNIEQNNELCLLDMTNLALRSLIKGSGNLAKKLFLLGSKTCLSEYHIPFCYWITVTKLWKYLIYSPLPILCDLCIELSLRMFCYSCKTSASDISFCWIRTSQREWNFCGCMAHVSSCMKKYNLDAHRLIRFHLLATKGERLGFNANSVLILMLSRSAILQSGFVLRI